MINIESTIQVSRPRNEVFGFLTDIDNLPNWQTGVIQSKRLSQGPVRVGFQFEETAKIGPWELQTVCAVTDLKENQRFAFEAKSRGPLDYRGSFDLQPVAGGTRVTLSGTAQLKGLWRLLQPLLESDIRKETNEELATMKRLLEAAPSGELGAVPSAL